MPLFRNKYFLFGLLVYIAAIVYLHFVFEQPFSDFLTAFIILGAGFSFIAWLFTKDLKMPFYKPAVKNEAWLLTALVVWIILYITYGGNLINEAIPKSWIDNEQMNSFVILIRKLVVFVAVPFLIYKAFGFSLKDFGARNTAVKFFSRRGLLLLTVLSIAALLFQYFLGNGSKPVRNGEFSIKQLMTGIPLTFLWYFIEAGLVEEFFYRGLLQSRLSVLLKSTTGAIVVAAIIFGLSHAPGLYLRGAESEGVTEQLPFLFWCAYTIAYMSIAGIFLGVAWSKTKNLWLVMAIHAMVDLLPNLPDFIHTWHI
jgi:membrane protease YdiL (CAAX protease family)